MKMYFPKISIWSVFYISLCFYFKWYKETIVLFSIILIHEYAHVLMAKYFKYDFKGVILYPFGAVAKINDYGWHINREDLWVAIAGICSHLFLLSFSNLFKHIFGEHLGNYYIQFNWQIMLFNMLPIYPLDGHKIIQCLLSYQIDYLKSIQISLVISYVCLFYLIRYNFQLHYLIVYIFLFMQILSYHKKYYYHYISFLINRKDDLRRKPTLNKKRVFYKNKQNYYLTKEGIINEKIAIKSRFFIDNENIWW